jgi:formate hydrogenlyase transcriptional activator
MKDERGVLYQTNGGVEQSVQESTERLSASDSELLQHLAAGTASSTGADFFKSLVRHVASALRVRYAFVTQCTDATLTRVRTLAFWDGKDFGDNFEYALAGTPCENVIAGSVCYYPKALQMLFPKDVGLVEWGAESFLGIPIRDSWQRILGHLAVFDDKPMDDRPRGVSILRIFAARAGVELERKRAEEELRGAYDDLRRVTSELRVLLDVNRAIGQHLEPDALFGAMASCLQGLLRTDRFGIELPLGDDKLQGHLLTPRGGLMQPTEPHLMPAAETACNWVIQNRQWFVTASREELRERFPTTFHVMTQEGMESLCAMPLLIGENCRGALFCMAAEEGAYRDLPQALLEKVAVAVAVALDNCLAHEEVRRLRDRLAAENIYLQEEIKTEYNFEEIIGQSVPLKRVLRNVEQVARTDATVLIHGETGTGKELIARAIHNLSSRKDRPLVKVNCGAISVGLVESELFGHEKGAFTGALQQRIGRFELADGGTIFLDEVSELPLDTQVKLLRVIQEGELERVGSSKLINVNVRVIAATNRNLAEAVKSGSFRSDLFYRLNVFPIEVPPLRERKSDIPLLVNFFITKFAKKLSKQVQSISKETMERLMNYPWPGNIRELQNVIERAVVLAQGSTIQIDESLLGLSVGSQTQGSVETLEDIERGHIIRVLEQTNWVIDGKRGAASILDINPNTLRSRMQKLGIKRPRGTV